MKKNRKKKSTPKTTKDSKRKDENDKENSEKVNMMKGCQYLLNVVFVVRTKVLAYPYPNLVVPVFQQL